MAISQNPLTGKMSGTVGNFVTSTYRGQNVIRSRAFNPKDANSEAQQKHRNVFRMLSDEYSSLAQLIKDGFPSRPQNQSAYNAFMAANLSGAVDKSGEYPVIDYPKMILSRGSLPKVNVLSAEVNTEGITVSYQPLSVFPGAAADDMVMAVTKTGDGAVFTVLKPRGDSETDSILLPASGVTKEDVLYIYLMVVSADKTKASQTVYVTL